MASGHAAARCSEQRVELIRFAGWRGSFCPAALRVPSPGPERVPVDSAESGRRSVDVEGGARRHSLYSMELRCEQYAARRLGSLCPPSNCLAVTIAAA